MLVNIDTSTLGFEISDKFEYANKAYSELTDGNFKGAEMRGWLRTADGHNQAELQRIKDAAHRICDTSDVLVVVGIGGSYLGALAAVDFIQSPNYNRLPKAAPDIFFTGTSLSADDISDTLQMIGNRDFSVNVISKSGTTAEPAAVFRLYKNLLEKKYGPTEAAKRIYATTDPESGALRAEAEREGYEVFSIPKDVGGRYSVLTPVGLLPMAVTGIDTDEVLAGAREIFGTSDGKAAALTYASARSALYEMGKKTEILAAFEPALHSLGEWWKQLFGESCGKEGKGIFPASVIYTTDLHSMGQYVQDGERMLFETFLYIGSGRAPLIVPEGAGEMSGKLFSRLNAEAYGAVRSAHLSGGVPNLTVAVQERSAETFGALTAFFMLSCAVSCIMDGVNPFDQPGVEKYKRNMKALFIKP